MDEQIYNNNMPQGSNGKGMAIASLVLGIVSIVFVCIWWIGLIAGIVGLVLGIAANKQGKTGVGTAGLVCSIIGVALGAIIIVLAIVGLSIGGML